MDVRQGRVIYVVAKFNEADAYYAIPWALMEADLEGGGYVVDQDKVKEHNMQIDHNVLSEIVLDKAFLNQIFDTYQLPKYWEENHSTSGKQSLPSNVDAESGGQEDHTATNGEASEGKAYGG